MATNYFAVESLIVARLKERIPQLKSVLGSGVGHGVEDVAKKPTVLVVYDGYEPMGRGLGKTLLRQRWQILLTVESINDSAGDSARGQAGVLIVEIISALSGWAPSAEFSTLEPAAGAAAVYKDSAASFHLFFYTHAAF
ncbi:MAG: hypothetical protein OEV92_00355 [Nitrospinota bacterium]|nr:hypothetical protein [Nitrospinota bacterium]